MSRFCSAAILSAVLLCNMGSTANAQFNYDFGSSGFDIRDFDPNPFEYTFVREYEVWATNPKPQWVWDIILIHGDGSEEVFMRGLYSENDALRWLLLGFDYMLYDSDSVVSSRIEKRNGRRPMLMETYGSIDDANSAFDWLDAFGWNPYIVTRYRTVRRW